MKQANRTPLNKLMIWTADHPVAFTAFWLALIFVVPAICRLFH